MLSAIFWTTVGIIIGALLDRFAPKAWAKIKKRRDEVIDDLDGDDSDSAGA